VIFVEVDYIWANTNAIIEKRKWEMENGNRFLVWELLWELFSLRVGCSPDRDQGLSHEKTLRLPRTCLGPKV
jgi:hypothetical protein